MVKHHVAVIIEMMTLHRRRGAAVDVGVSFLGAAADGAICW